jgi:SAM-dependent methyltransferase
MRSNASCPNCDSAGISVFFELQQVPAHSVLLMPTRESALGYPKGDIRLGFCDTCGFISNVAFDPGLNEYSSRYEETQGFSATFNAFARNLAAGLIERYDLHGKDLIEIGCGKGEFLTLLCEMGHNRGIGFDPSYVSDRTTSEIKDRVTFVTDFYSEKYAGYRADFICCKMTLEHIDRTAEFVRMVRRSIGNRPDTIVFFQVPDVSRVLRDIAFWDVYYEHCSYFSAGSLARLFRSSGFDIVDLRRDYDDQYLMIEARPGSGAGDTFPAMEDDLVALEAGVQYYAAECRHRLDRWKTYLQACKREGQRVVLWGSGSKGVAFLTTLGIQDEIEYTVDINPYKHGTFMAGTGQEIVAPEFLREYQPHIVIIMNPIYEDEIRQYLGILGLNAEIVSIDR